MSTREIMATSPLVGPGNYFVVSLHGLYPGAIKLATRSHWSHAGIVVPADLVPDRYFADMPTWDGKPQLWVVEAEPHGARARPLSAYAGYDMAFNLGEDLSDATRQAIVQTAIGLLGIPYNWYDITALGLDSLHLPVPPPLLHAAEDHRRLICSALVTVACRGGGLNPAPGKHAGLVTPAMLADRPGVEVVRAA